VNDAARSTAVNTISALTEILSSRQSKIDPKAGYYISNALQMLTKLLYDLQSEKPDASRSEDQIREIQESVDLAIENLASWSSFLGQDELPYLQRAKESLIQLRKDIL
jgi:hypothetical protein